MNRLTALLPDVEASAQQKAAIATLATAATSALVPAAGEAVTKILNALIDASGPGSCVTVHPVHNSEGLTAEWAETDLTSDPFSGIGNRNWMWDVQTGRVTPASDRHDNGFRTPKIDAARFTQLLNSVTG